MQETARLVDRNCRWECDGLPFFAGEEDCCINAGTILGDAGPFTFVAADALTMKVREGGRVINAVVLLATGVNGDGHHLP
jgi:Transposase, Mutator family